MEDEKINIKDIHETFWRCRDFELSNLWQRSIFLSAFLILCFTGYGNMVMKILDYVNSEDTGSLLIMHIFSFGISMLGIVFSILWIKMGKGSKAWYENYERAILAMERNKKYSSEEASEIGGFNYPKLPNYPNANINNCILSGTAGQYSVSKINIAIGQVFLIVWTLASIIHAIWSAINLNSITSSTCISCISFSISLLFIIILIFSMGKSTTFQSSTL